MITWTKKKTTEIHDIIKRKTSLCQPRHQCVFILHYLAKKSAGFYNIQRYGSARIAPHLYTWPLSLIVSLCLPVVLNVWCF